MGLLSGVVRRTFTWPPSYLELLLLFLFNLFLYFTLPTLSTPLPPTTAAPEIAEIDSGGASTIGVYMLVSAPAEPENEAREKDMTQTLRANLQLRDVASITLLLDGLEGNAAGHSTALRWVQDALTPLPPLHKKKLSLVLQKSQPTYADLFDYASDKLKNRLVVVAHADIELHPTSLACLSLVFPGLSDAGNGQAGDAASAVAGRPVLLTLTRHPHPDCPDSSSGGALPTLPFNLCLEPMVSRDGGRRAVNSADAFVFRAPVPPSAAERLSFLPNRRGAENRLAYVMAAAGYDIQNPCHAVRVYHRHCDVAKRSGGSALGSARVDSGGQSRPLPRTPLSCPAWGNDQRTPLRVEN